MSLRATTDHIDYYGREHLFEIYDDQWGGSVTALKNTGRGFGQFSHQVLDPKKPWENPIQKGVLELSVWLSSTDLLDDIKDGDEQQFHIIHKIDSTQEWAGYIYNDLTTYEENILPFRVTLVAKDFTDLGGKDFLVSSALPDNRETVITTIATLLNEVGFDIPIKTHTSWIEDNITSSQDYLRQINHETKALREFGKTGDESDTAITVEDALNKLCSNHKLILKQTGGAYWIDQLTAYDNPASVQETVYDIDGSLDTAESNVDTTVSANTTDLKVVISSDNRDNSGLPGLKRAKVKFDHRTEVQNIQFPSRVETDGSTNISETFSQFFVSDGDQVINLDVRGTADHGALPENSKGRVQIKAGSYWWNDATRQWVGTNTVNEFDLTVWTLQKARGFVSFQTETTPSDADGQLEITFLNAIDDNGAADATVYDEIVFSIDNQVGEENTTSIDYVLTQSGSFSVVEEFEDDWYGDGPIGYAVSALRHGSGDGDTTSDSWGRRGQTADKNFHENQLKEPMDLRRGWRRLLTALLKGVYYPHNVLSYDSEFFYYLGGRWDLFTGNFQADLFSLDIVTGSDTFEDIPKFTDETGSGSGSTGGSTGGGGLSQSTADARYFKQASLLSEVSAGDLPTLYGNIGLDDGSADLDLGSLDINGATFVDSSRNVNAIEGVFNGDVTIAKNNPIFKINDTDGTTRLSTIVLGTLGGLWEIRAKNDLHFYHNIVDAEVVTIGRSSGAVSLANTLTINSQLLFTLGNEQLLSTDAGVDFVDLTLTDFLTVGGLSTFNGAIDANSTANFEGVMTLQDNITADGFSAGFQGAEWQITNAGQAEFEDVFIRGGLTAYEAIINRVRYNFGNTVLSAGGGKVASVSGSAGSETVVFEDPEGNTILPVAEGDLLLLQNWDLNRSTIIKRICRKVASISGTDVTLTKDGDMPSDTGSIVAGDELVVNGNDGTTANRDAIIFQSVTETTHPFIKIQDNINSFTDWGSNSTTQVLIGDLTDAPDLSNGTTPSGIGFFAKGSAYLEGEIVASSGNIADWTIESEYITKGALGDGRIEIFSDNSVDPLGAYSGTTALGIPTISLLKQDTDFSDRMYLMFGETFVGSSWTGRIGISMIENFGDSTPYFELSKDASTGDITANIAGFNFDDTDLWTGSSSKSSATARFGSTEGLIFDVGGGASETDQRTLKWLDSGSLRGGMFVSAGGRTQIVGYDGSNPVVGVQIDDQVELSLPVKMVDGEVYMLDLPTSDPSSPGQLWNDSGTLKVSTTSPPSAPSAPSNPSLCKNTTLNVLRFEWDSVASADSYDVYRSTDGSNFSFITNTSITRYDDSVPFNDQSQLYYYKVQARNDGGNSGFSSTVNDSWNTATAC